MRLTAQDDASASRSETLDDASAPRPGSPGRLGFLASIFLVAALVRAVRWREVLTVEGVIFSDGDAYSHMWRIWRAASQSIPLSARDPFVNFPHGGEVLWSPAFDWIMAKLVGGIGLDRAGAELACAAAPLILGALAVAVAAWIAARQFSRKAGWICGVMLACLPGSVLYTRFGYLDHHAAIALIGTAMLGGTMRIVSSKGSGPRFWAPLAGLMGSLALLVWAGALMHIGILQLGLLVWALGPASSALARDRTRRLALAHATLAITILPFSLRTWEVFGSFDPLALTRFQPTWYGAAALCLASTRLLWQRPGFGTTRAARLGTAAVTGCVGLALAFALIPELAGALDRSAGWFTHDVEFLVNIQELAPLFAISPDAPLRGPTLLLSPLLFALPLSMLVVAGRTSGPQRWLLLFWTAVFGVLTLTQFRFINTFSIAHSIVSAGALAWLLDRIGEKSPTPRARRLALAGMGIALATILVAVPAATYYAPRITNEQLSPLAARRMARRGIARWLAASHPAPLDADGAPTAALLSEWSGGHEIRYYSGWAVNQDGFGPYVSPENTELATRYFESTNEDRAIEILEALGTRYVLADDMGGGRPPYAANSMARRLVQSAGSGAETIPEWSDRPRWIPALTRHRLVYGRPNGRGGAWLYEVVPGAIVTGSAEPGTRADLELRIDTPSGRPRVWSTRARVDAAGRFRLRVPYATVNSPDSAFVPLGRYRLRTRDGSVEFDVPEALIQRGGRIEAPTVGG